MAEMHYYCKSGTNNYKEVYNKLNFSPLWLSMPSLLEHSVAEPTKYRFLLRNLMQSNSFLIRLKLTCVGVVGLCIKSSIKGRTKANY